MDNPLAQAFEPLFDARDTNHDGILERTDFEQTDLLVKSYQLPSDDHRIKLLEDGYKIFWEQLLPHSGSDSDRMTKEQFVQALTMAAHNHDSSHSGPLGQQMVFGLCDIADTGGDFALDKDEFVRFAKVLGGDEERALYAFTELDKGSGVVSRQEMFNAFRDYLQGQDLQAPGGVLLGTLM